ncbi:MAG: hypothetical protein U5K54_25760 [Cytophagales bacterium]|nr:hypothetical protein [Cytophagales bacterium]
MEKVITPLSLPSYFMLLEARKVAECAYFLDEGFAMSYTFVKGKKQVEWLWRSGQIMMSAKSFFEQLPSQNSFSYATTPNCFVLLMPAYSICLRNFLKHTSSTE